MSANRKRKSETELDIASTASKQSSDQNSSTIPEEIQDLKVLDCTECFDKDSEIQALKKSNSEVDREAAYRKLKVFETSKKYFEKKIASMELLHKKQNTEFLKINDDLKAAVFEKSSEIKSLKERNEKYQNLQADVDSKNSTTKDLREAIVLTNIELMKVKQDSKEAVDSKNSEIKALQISKMHIEDDLKKVKQELQAEVESKNSDFKALREDANASTNNHEIQAFKELNNLKTEVLSKNSEITTLKERNNYLFIKNNDLKKDTKELQAEVDSKHNLSRVFLR